jgi:hypothetical protein
MPVNDSSFFLLQNNNCLKELCIMHDDELEDFVKLKKSYEEKMSVLKQEK